LRIFIKGAFFVRSHPLPYEGTARRVRANNLPQNLSGQDFNASYKQLYTLFGLLRQSAYFGQTKGA